MTVSREREVSQAFVSMATSLASGYDVVDLLEELTADCVRLLDVASAGLLLADRNGVLHVMAATSERLRQLEVLQLQRAEGPCLDCFRNRTPVSVADLGAERQRWPQFVPAALAAGVASVHAVPMRLRNTGLGALGLFGAETGTLNADDLALGQALADVASVALVQEKAAADRTVVNEQLQTALSSRIILEQAKGVLAQSGDLDMAEAFTVLRSYARARNMRLSDIAHAVVARTLAPQQLFDHALARRSSRT